MTGLHELSPEEALSLAYDALSDVAERQADDDGCGVWEHGETVAAREWVARAVTGVPRDVAALDRISRLLADGADGEVRPATVAELVEAVAFVVAATGRPA